MGAAASKAQDDHQREGAGNDIKADRYDHRAGAHNNLNGTTSSSRHRHYQQHQRQHHQSTSSRRVNGHADNHHRDHNTRSSTRRRQLQHSASAPAAGAGGGGAGQAQFGYLIQQVGDDPNQVQVTPGYYYASHEHSKNPSQQQRQHRSHRSSRRHNSAPTASGHPSQGPAGGALSTSSSHPTHRSRRGQTSRHRQDQVNQVDGFDLDQQSQQQQPPPQQRRTNSSSKEKRHRHHQTHDNVNDTADAEPRSARSKSSLKGKERERVAMTVSAAMSVSDRRSIPEVGTQSAAISVNTADFAGAGGGGGGNAGNADNAGAGAGAIIDDVDAAEPADPQTAEPLPMPMPMSPAGPVQIPTLPTLKDADSFKKGRDNPLPKPPRNVYKPPQHHDQLKRSQTVDSAMPTSTSVPMPAGPSITREPYHPNQKPPGRTQSHSHSQSYSHSERRHKSESSSLRHPSQQQHQHQQHQHQQHRHHKSVDESQSQSKSAAFAVARNGVQMGTTLNEKKLPKVPIKDRVLDKLFRVDFGGAGGSDKREVENSYGVGVGGRPSANASATPANVSGPEPGSGESSKPKGPLSALRALSFPPFPTLPTLPTFSGIPLPLKKTILNRSESARSGGIRNFGDRDGDRELRDLPPGYRDVGPPVSIPLNSPINPASPYEVVYKKRPYPTAAHLFEAHKFLKHNPELAERLRMAVESPAEMGKLSYAFQMEGMVRDDWELVWRDKLDEVMWLKFSQHPELREELLSTGYSLLLDGNEVRHADPDTPGVNELGKAYMRLRDRLRLDGSGQQS